MASPSLKGSRRSIDSYFWHFEQERLQNATGYGAKREPWRLLGTNKNLYLVFDTFP